MPSSVEGKSYNKAIYLYAIVIRIVNENVEAKVTRKKRDYVKSKQTILN